MQESTVNKILAINNEFYQTFALRFSETRMRIQPGVRNILQRIPDEVRLLDLGCGNGEVAYALAARGYRGQYVGIDSSEPLLMFAKKRLERFANFRFLLADLAQPDWNFNLPPEKYDYVFAFAVLHHIPGRDLRLKLLNSIRNYLPRNGKFIHSNWQFINSERLRKRIQPWEKVSIRDDELDSGDYLLDWRHGGVGLRYVHLFDEKELMALARDTGFQVIETFYSDGEGGNLGLYQVWQLNQKQTD